MHTPIKISALPVGAFGRAVQAYLLAKGAPGVELLLDAWPTERETGATEDPAEEVLFILADWQEAGQEKLAKVLGRGQRDPNTFTVVVTLEPLGNGAATNGTLRGNREVAAAAADAMIVLPATGLPQANPAPATLQAIYKVITHLTDLALDAHKADVSIDFEDVKTVLRGTGYSFVGIGQASGADRAMEAATQAISYPFMRKEQLENSARVLLNIFSGPTTELEMEELTQITDLIQDACGDDCEVIFGHGLAEVLDQDIEVFLLATQ
ncbi:hypothetical protein [Rufibacter sp. LB8]|uniref:hypothetical protein n=1 Tax=Rufibacter sp. LB8 TaxID=2777781 RepID=UPI00178C4C8A|nr:hypothetical protein [Rufibacter sp. LB8]